MSSGSKYLQKEQRKKRKTGQILTETRISDPAQPLVVALCTLCVLLWFTITLGRVVFISTERFGGHMEVTIVR